MATTVYPSIAGAFPPASFLTFGDAFAYMRTLQAAPCGICSCPAKSYLSTHYPDTLRYTEEVSENNC